MCTSFALNYYPYDFYELILILLEEPINMYSRKTITNYYEQDNFRRNFNINLPKRKVYKLRRLGEFGHAPSIEKKHKKRALPPKVNISLETREKLSPLFKANKMNVHSGIAPIYASIYHNNDSYISAMKPSPLRAMERLTANSFIDKNAKEVIIPKCIKSIEEETFAGFNNLQRIVIPESITTIGNRAFAECPNLREVTIPNSVTTIGDYAFYDCPNLRQIAIPNSVTTIGDYAFYGCPNLRQIVIPRVTTIGTDAFDNGCQIIRE